MELYVPSALIFICHTDDVIYYGQNLSFDNTSNQSLGGFSLKSDLDAI